MPSQALGSGPGTGVEYWLKYAFQQIAVRYSSAVNVIPAIRKERNHLTMHCYPKVFRSIKFLKEGHESQTCGRAEQARLADPKFDFCGVFATHRLHVRPRSSVRTVAAMGTLLFELVTGIDVSTSMILLCFCRVAP